MNFFIAGLPRSRTAWLANLFTYKDAYCFHEARRHVKDMYGMRELFASKREGYVGTSDSSLPFYYEDIREMMPTAKLAIVERSPDEVLESLYGLFEENEQFINVVEKTQKKLEEIKHKYSPHVISFEDLDDPKKVEELWYHLLPGVEFDIGRYEMLNELNIEINKEKYMKGFIPSNLSDIIKEFA